jgi:acetylornithine deacetylase/succinyl-diaminopimelate desuccinylase-like protein
VDRTVRDLAERPMPAAAREWLRRHDGDVLAWQRAIAEIPAPTGAEEARGAFLAERFAALGLEDVRRDAAGNVLGRLGPMRTEGVGVVLAAHLDTVFPPDTDHTVRDVDGRLVAPGICDNARGLAALLAVAAALRHAGAAPARPLTFVATTGEEGGGDLKGVKHLFEDSAFVPDAFVAVDGVGTDRVVHRALGSRRLRAVYRGPGGHSWAAFGVANPAHAVGFAASGVAGMALPPTPRSAASVVRIGGGSGLNTIPQDAWLELDLRSESETALDVMYAGVTEAFVKALDTANRQRTPGTASLTLEVVPLGTRPSGVTNVSHRLVRSALAATRLVGHTPELAAASTDASVAIARGVPGIALGGGGRGGDPHLPTEWYDNTGGPDGLYRLLLVALAAAEIPPGA